MNILRERQMAPKKKPFIKYLLIGIAVLISLVCFLTFIFPVIPVFQGIHGQKVLLQQTDYQELLMAGRELINKAEWEEYVTMKDGQKIRRLVIPEDVRRPEVIRKLMLILSGLGSLDIYNNRCIRIDFSHRVVEHFGVLIFPEDFNEPESKSVNHYDIMLIPGLWYFDDRLDEETPSLWLGPEYKKYIENMIKENKYLNN